VRIAARPLETGVKSLSMSWRLDGEVDGAVILVYLTIEIEFLPLKSDLALISMQYCRWVYWRRFNRFVSTLSP